MSNCTIKTVTHEQGMAEILQFLNSATDLQLEVALNVLFGGEEPTFQRPYIACNIFKIDSEQSVNKSGVNNDPGTTFPSKG